MGTPRKAVQTQIEREIEDLPGQLYSVMFPPVSEYIIGIDILKGLTLNLSDGQYTKGLDFKTKKGEFSGHTT